MEVLWSVVELYLRLYSYRVRGCTSRGPGTAAPGSLRTLLKRGDGGWIQLRVCWTLVEGGRGRGEGGEEYSGGCTPGKVYGSTGINLVVIQLVVQLYSHV